MSMPVMEQNPKEFNLFLDKIEELQIESILEIGVFRGGTLAQFGQRFPYCTIIGVDPNPQIERWAPEWGGINLVIGLSQSPDIRREVISRNDNRPFDIIWIDGDHKEEAVRADWEFAKNNCRKVVAFHDIIDSNNEMIEVYRLWNELEADERYNTEVISFSGGCWGIGMVYL